MNPGKMNKRITLQQEQKVKDNEGISGKVWGDVASVWASVEPLRGKEYFQAAAIGAETTIRVRIRYRSGITAAMRVIYGARTLNIRSVVDPNERHQEIHLMCEEVIDGN